MYLVYTPSKYWKSNKDNLGRFDFLLFQSSYLCTHENTFDRYKVVAVDGVSQYWKYSITSMDSLSHLCSTYLISQWSEIYEKKWNLGNWGCLPKMPNSKIFENFLNGVVLKQEVPAE